MSKNTENIYANLKRIFHEPSRLAIMSALARERDGLTFNELKDECGLTFGNLSSHLKTLQDAEMIQVKKFFVGKKPCTQLSLCDMGRQSFIDYLKALEEALERAAGAVSTSDKKDAKIVLSAKAALQQR